MNLKDCDVIMKGGITSGVVYPKAVLKLSETYRFRSIGGTSVGAIAAAATAAAEYGRVGGGFARLNEVPAELQSGLADLFQPVPAGATLFALFKHGMLERRPGRALLVAAKAFWPWLALGLGGGGVLALLSCLLGGGWYGASLGLLLGASASVGLVACALVREVRGKLPKLDFGLCPGTTQKDAKTKALSDWLAVLIEWLAGRLPDRQTEPTGAPLTFGDLWRGSENGTGDAAHPQIDLRMMTTNLSMRRPYALPRLDDRNYLFKPEEFRAVFPAWVVDWMIGQGGCFEHSEHPGYHFFPEPEMLPVAVAARMSLSFPFLISAVPIHRQNFPDGVPDETPPLWRMLFSDGGLSSNFPIHFFDTVLPNRPTFGISLDDYNSEKPDKRVYLPMSAGAGRWLDSRAITSVVGFLMALLDAAKDWQDRLQTALPGYRERVVHVYLSPDEGGLNLTMPSEKISELADLGKRAGTLLAGQPAADHPEDRDPFDVDDHRWRRYLSAYAAIEEALEITGTAWGTPDQQDSFARFIQTYMQNPRSYKKSPEAWRQEIFDRMNNLMLNTSEWRTRPLRHEKGAIPPAKARLTIAPDP